MRNCLCLLTLFCLLGDSWQSVAQRWLWGQHISYTPFAVNSHGGYIASDNAGNVYTAACLGSFSGTNGNLELGGVTSHCGSLSITDSIIDSTSFGQTIITKYDGNGVALWIVGTQRCDVGITNIAADINGNVYVLGVYDHTGTIGNYPMVIPPGNNHNDNGMYFLAKISTTGNVLWARNIFATISEEGWMDEIVDSSNGGESDYWCFEEYYPYGGVAVDTTGNCYVAGLFIDSSVTLDAFTLSKADTSPNSIDMFVAKFDPSGVAVWANRYGGRGSFQPKSPIVSSQGDLYVAGTYGGDSVMTFGPYALTAALANPNLPGDFMGAFLVKMDNNGDPLWAIAPDSVATINSVTADTAGYVYITGQYKRDSINFGGHELVNYVQNARHGDVFLAKYDASGSALWAIDGGGAINASSSSVTTDQCGHVFISGSLQSNGTDTTYALYFKGTELFAPAPNSYPMFIASFDAGGNYLTGQSLPDGGLGGIIPIGILSDNRGNLLVGGQWAAGSYSFGPDNFAPDSGESFMFVTKLQYDSSGCMPYAGEGVPPVTAPSADILLYPNPAFTQLNITSTNHPISGVIITNPLGQTVKDYPDQSTILSSSAVAQGSMTTQIDITDLQPGIYLIKINEAVVRKFIKE